MKYIIQNFIEFYNVTISYWLWGQSEKRSVGVKSETSEDQESRAVFTLTTVADHSVVK